MSSIQQLHYHRRFNAKLLHKIFITSRRPICLTRCLAANVEQETGQKVGEKTKRPDLKKSLGPQGPKRLVAVACILVVIYMYPMIFKPLLGIGSSDSPEKKSEDLKKIGLDPSKTRPRNMPEWTSPFGPKTGRDI